MLPSIAQVTSGVNSAAQLSNVLKLLADATANGAGRSYLIQHSAGSGKSNTIAWAAHRLSTLHTAEDRKVFDIVKTLKPSARNELEITDVNNAYIRDGELSFDILKGWWTDAGTPPSKLKASILVALNKGVTFHA